LAGARFAGALDTLVALVDGAAFAARLAIGARFAGAFLVGLVAGPADLADGLEEREPTLALPPTVTEPVPGTMVDSSPVDHLIRRSVPLTPVTTPSRGGWPSFRDATWTRSPTVAISTSIDPALA
jgi:hypothetical protein